MRLAILMKPALADVARRRTTTSARCSALCPRTGHMSHSTKWDQLTRWTTKLISCWRSSTTDRSKVGWNLMLATTDLINDCLAATMWVYPDFFSYRTGIYRRSTHGSEQAKGFHSVRLVGWGEERFGYQTTKYWVSWLVKLRMFIRISLILSSRSPPTPGENGGARAASSRSCAAPTNAKSKTTSCHRSLTFTRENPTVVKWSAWETDAAETHKLIKCPSWYMYVLQCNWKTFQSLFFVAGCMVRQRREVETHLPRFA